ncbi:MAG: YicC family protein [Nitrospirae bacterium GWC2_57_13]|nr:MAG: YicC family protein [Nitrospirae bacterium GWC2_57_13]
MTGYGRADARSGTSSFAIEIRSVNSRFIDIQMRTPKVLVPLEPRIRKAIQEKFSRGRFDLFVTRNGEGARAGRIALDSDRADQYVKALTELKRRYSLPDDVDLALLAGREGVFTAEEAPDDAEALWKDLAGGMAKAFEALDVMRVDEGKALARDISSRLVRIEELAQEIGVRAPRSLEEARKRLTDSVRKLLGDAEGVHHEPDPLRMAQEIALLADRTDISEELTRFASHLRQFRSLLAAGKTEAVGRKLDFLLQELNREVNTLASKAQDADISYGAVNIKAELEKIKEQVQNIE